MIEPRAWEIEDANGAVFVRLHRLIDINRVVAVKKTPLTTVADVLAALRQPSEAMLMAAEMSNVRGYRELFIAMLDQFEKEQHP